MEANGVNQKFIKGLRQSVDFFKDFNDDPDIRQVVTSYSQTQQDTKQLLELIENTDEPDENDLDCNEALLSLDFISTVFKINPQKTIEYLENLIMNITPWIYNKKTLIPTIQIFLMITEMVEAQSLSHTIFDGFPDDFLLDLLNPENVAALESRKDCLPGIVDLLTALTATSPAFRHKILQSLECKTFIEGVFDPLYKTNFVYKNIFSDEHKANQICIKLMCFTSTLSTFDEAWKQCYEILLKREDTICSVAVALLNGDKAVKLQSLRLIKNFDDNTIANLAEHLPENIQSFVTGYNADEALQKGLVSISSSEERVNELLPTSDSDQPNTNEIDNLKYKHSEMERQLKTTLNAVNELCIGSDHQLTQLRGQVDRLQQSLFEIKHLVGSRTADTNDLTKQLEKSTLEKNKQQSKMKNLLSKLKEKLEIKLQLQTEVEIHRNKILEMDAENTLLKISLAISLEENSQKTKMLAECEQKMTDWERARETFFSVGRTD